MTSNTPVRFLNRTTPPHIATLVLITGMAAMALNMFLPSLPTMTEYLQTEYRVMQLSVALYLGAVAVLQTIVGPLSDRFGRRPILLIGAVIFLFATVGCLTATSAEAFLVFRMIQAAISVSMVLSRAIARDMFDQSQAASMIGYITMGMSLVPMIGPVLGGYLDQNFGWQSSFTLVLIFGSIVLWLVWADLGETNTQKSASFKAQFKAYPELIRSRRFWGYALSAGFASGAFFAFLGGAPFVAVELLGLDPAQMGLYFVFISIGYMGGNFLAGRFSNVIGLNRMMFFGSMVAVFGMLLAIVLWTIGLQHPLSFFGSLMFVGLGNGMILPNANAGIVSVRPHLAGSASGLGGAVMIGGGAALSAITGTMLTIETGAWPLLFMMFGSVLLAVITSGYVIYVARKAGELGHRGVPD